MATLHLGVGDTIIFGTITTATLEEQGIARERLQIDLNKMPQVRGEQDQELPRIARQSVLFHAADRPSAEQYTVRLHFAELDEVAPGQRVFDVLLQNEVVLKDFDVMQEAGSRFTALVKTFPGITAERVMNLRLVPKAAAPDAHSVPILSGIEVRRAD